jgi:hypothetical protein
MGRRWRKKMDLDDAQKKDFAAWKEVLEAEKAQITNSIENLSEEVRLLRTRRGLLSFVVKKYGSPEAEEFRKSNIEGLSQTIKEKEAELDSKETGDRVRLTHLNHIISEIESWLKKSV